VVIFATEVTPAECPHSPVADIADRPPWFWWAIGGLTRLRSYKPGAALAARARLLGERLKRTRCWRSCDCRGCTSSRMTPRRCQIVARSSRISRASRLGIFTMFSEQGGKGLSCPVCESQPCASSRNKRGRTEIPRMRSLNADDE
jgi:hypothetical protein